MAKSFVIEPLADLSQQPVGNRRRFASGWVGDLAVATVGVTLLAAAAGCSSNGSAAAKGIHFPSKIASLKKSADQSRAKDILGGLHGAARKQIRAIAYQDASDSSRKVVVYGGAGVPVPPGDPAAQLRQLLTNDGKASGFTSVSPGSIGGKAECVAVSQVKLINCGWISGKAVLVMSFQGFDNNSAKSLVPQMLSAMVNT